MEPIQPLYGLDEEHPVPGVLIHPQPPAFHAPIQEILGIQVDLARLHRDQQYLLELVDQILNKARGLFKVGRYAQATQLYERVFTYQYFLKVTNAQAMKIFFPAMLEYAYSLELLQRKDEAQHFLNQQLLKLLEPTLHRTDDARFAQIREQVQRLQEAGEFPDGRHQAVAISPDVLKELARQYEAIQYPQTALAILGHQEVRQLLELLHTRHHAHQLIHVDPTALFEPHHPLPPPWFSVWGLPVVPVMPGLQGAPHAAETHYPQPYLHPIERIKPTSGLHKDPHHRPSPGDRPPPQKQ